MKTWKHHFMLGTVIGVFSIVMMRAFLSSDPRYDNDSNLLVTFFIILFYGAITTGIGEALTSIGRKH